MESNQSNSWDCFSDKVAFVKSPTSVRSWPDNLFISGGNPHLIGRFCGVVLGSTTISNMVSEPLHDSLGRLLPGFRYRATHH
ncbi:hypothetical protein MTR_8g097110 [Medicago truncatula]|uniref:Uncharacterized protein n=1 Tax=Medicago truncatula TaxID=3880 RepID=G7LHA5_MEDTR|nr:hypothetical protein MTR_8g097110 [Medicago truncatula]